MAIQHILGLLKGVVRGSLRPSFDLIESRSNVCGRFGLSANGVKVGCDCVLALGKGNKLVAGALDDGKRNEVARHFSSQGELKY